MKTIGQTIGLTIVYAMTLMGVVAMTMTTAYVLILLSLNQ
jgi:hypothetical protein